MLVHMVFVRSATKGEVFLREINYTVFGELVENKHNGMSNRVFSIYINMFYFHEKFQMCTIHYDVIYLLIWITSQSKISPAYFSSTQIMQIKSDRIRNCAMLYTYWKWIRRWKQRTQQQQHQNNNREHADMCVCAYAVEWHGVVHSSKSSCRITEKKKSKKNFISPYYFIDCGHILGRTSCCTFCLFHMISHIHTHIYCIVKYYIKNCAHCSYNVINLRKNAAKYA